MGNLRSRRDECNVCIGKGAYSLQLLFPCPVDHFKFVLWGFVIEMLFYPLFSYCIILSILVADLAVGI